MRVPTTLPLHLYTTLNLAKPATLHYQDNNSDSLQSVFQPVSTLPPLPMDHATNADDQDPQSTPIASDYDDAASSVFGSDDGRSTTSSGDMSGVSTSSSGEFVHILPPPDPPAGRERCVGRSRGVEWGSAAAVGRRKEMEDALAVVPGFMAAACDAVGGCTAPGSKAASEVSPVHFFGVFDGHGGSQVARFCSEQIHVSVAAEWDRGGGGVDSWSARWEQAFLAGFENVDNDIGDEPVAHDMVGSTAVTVVVSGCQIIASNCGDSRAVLCRGNKTIQLTSDHKPDREDELARIEGGGGKVINWNGARVLGVLAMSRAIGDRYLRPWVIPVPEITFMTRMEEDECLVIASDGLWDVMTNDEVGNLTCQLLKRCRRISLDNGKSPAQAVADHLVELAYRKNSYDNISVIVVDLKPRGKRLVKKK